MKQIYKGVGRAVTTAATAVRKTVERGVKMGRQLAEQGARAARLGASRALRLARTAADMIPSPRRVAATCFVAGTLVLSAEGLVPIETIAVGDEVWSRDEASGAEAWQTVEDTFITHPKELIYLEYEIANAEGGGSDYGELIGTAEHPFWVTNREAWVPMGELEIGDQLQLAHDGGEAIVTKLTLEIAPQGVTFTTYNFAVANWATYFVAPKNSPPNTAGIWVHNLGEKTCEQILQTLNTAIDSGKSQKVHQINKILSNAHAQGKLDPKVLTQAQEKIDAATKSGKISPATNRLSTKCFPEGTLVATADGLKPIEQFEEGEPFETGEVVERKILKLEFDETDTWIELEFSNGARVVSTRGHLYWIESSEAWVQAIHLETGMTVMTCDDETLSVVSSTLIPKTSKEKTYNFEVDGLHNYFVGESRILVHNGVDDETFKMPSDWPGQGMDGMHNDHSAPRSMDPFNPYIESPANKKMMPAAMNSVDKMPYDVELKQRFQQLVSDLRKHEGLTTQQAKAKAYLAMEQEIRAHANSLPARAMNPSQIDNLVK